MATKKTAPVYIRAKCLAFHASSRVRPGQVLALPAGSECPSWAEVVDSPADAGKGATPPPALATMSDLTHNRVGSAPAGAVPPTSRESAEHEAAGVRPPMTSATPDGDLLS